MAVVAIENARVLATTPDKTGWTVGLMTELQDDLGTGLRHARERSGVSLHHIAKVTKLSVRTLDALERNRIDQLPGGIYRRAIVRAYAAEVGLDPERTVREFLTRYPDDVPSMAQLVPSQQAEHRSRSSRVWQAVASVLGTVIPILAGVFYFTSLAGGSERVRPAVPASASPAWTIDAQPASAAYGSGVRMMITVSSPTVLQIVADGQEVAARRFEAGEVVRLDVARDVVLMGDDAGAVHFSINGRAGRSLGESGDPLSTRILRASYQDWLIDP